MSNYDTYELKEFLERKREEFRMMRKDGWVPRITEQLRAIEKAIMDLQFELDQDEP